MATAPNPARLRNYWALDPSVHYLNHGAYGACPLPVLEAQREWQARIESQPVRFMSRELPGLLRGSASQLAEFLGGRGEDLALVENATAGVNAVLRSYPWRAGDALLLSAYAYPAVQATARFIAAQFGVKVNTFEVPVPLQQPAAILDRLQAALTPHTRMALLDHVASPLALVYPLAEMVAVCRARGVATLVDGAHAPGMLALDVPALGADWYVGNCHKWLFAPRGSAFLWAAPGARSFLQPVTVSYRMEEGFPHNFDWVGTRDYTPWLAIPAALEFYREMGGRQIPGWLHEKLLVAVQQLAQAWEVELPAPRHCFGAMAILPLPWPVAATQQQADAIHDALWENARVEVPVIPAGGRLWLRISQQLYNGDEDISALQRALIEVRDRAAG